jgi:hypothetical protein
VELDQHTGSLLNAYFVVPQGSVGGGIWSSAAALSDGSQLWVTTGNADPNGSPPGDSTSVVRLSGSNLAKQDAWTLAVDPHEDSDFGASPTLFVGTVGGKPTQLVGACNKDGKFYALNSQNLAAGPVWSFQVGSDASAVNLCLAAAIWDASQGRLFVAGNSTVIGGSAYQGSLRRIDPSTGLPIWEQGLPCVVLGSPALNAATGVIAVATWGDCSSGKKDAAYVYDASSGAQLVSLDSGGSQIFGQPVFADSYLFVARQHTGLAAYKPGG